jgi:hypothetical protein
MAGDAADGDSGRSCHAAKSLDRFRGCREEFSACTCTRTGVPYIILWRLSPTMPHKSPVILNTLKAHPQSRYSLRRQGPLLGMGRWSLLARLRTVHPGAGLPLPAIRDQPLVQNGSLYIADTFNNSIRVITNSGISTIAGDGANGTAQPLTARLVPDDPSRQVHGTGARACGRSSRGMLSLCIGRCRPEQLAGHHGLSLNLRTNRDFKLSNSTRRSKCCVIVACQFGSQWPGFSFA